MSKASLLILAAGLGSRYGGDKQIDRIGPDGEILMQYSIFDAVKAGFDKIVLVIKPSYRELLEDLLSPFAEAGIEICFEYQDFSSIPSFYRIPAERVKPFGTVHALLCAKNSIKEPFALINADDFYGADAFKVIHDALLSLDANNAAMVTYRLKNTVSLNGTVTRGVCQIENGALRSVCETYGIGYDADGNIIDEKNVILNASLPVSMNMWGFRPEIFTELECAFNDFLLSIPDDEIKAEYVIPSFVDTCIKNGSLTVKALSTAARWFGVTYREDRPIVAQKLSDMKASGEYPPLLSLK